MKNTFLLGSAFLYCYFIVSCTSASKEASVIQISGEIAHYDQTEIILESVFGQHKTTVEDTHFIFEFPSEDVHFYKLKFGHQEIPVFVLPGKPLEVSFDAEDVSSSVQFEGKTAKESQYLLNHAKVDDHAMGKRVTLDHRVDYYTVHKAHYDDKKRILDSLHSILPKFDSRFYDMANANIGFVSAEERIYFHINQSQNQDTELVKEDFTFLDSIDFNRPEHLHIPNFKRLLSAYVSYKAPKQWMSSLDEVFEAIALNLTDKQTKELAYFMEIDGAINYKGIEGVAEKLAFFKAYSTNTYYIKTLDKGFQKWAHLLPGEKAPPIEVQNTKGEKITLSDYYGKVVYIDLWATWCGPCKKELPHLANLKENYKNSPKIEILAISMDNNRADWTLFLEENKLQGKQFWNKEAFSSEWSKKYLVNSIPRFILIDSDGSIVSATAPRPSQTDKLIPMIDELLDNRGTSI